MTSKESKKIKMYGKYATKAKDIDQIAKEQREESRQKTQFKTNDLLTLRNNRVFYHNCSKYLAQSNLNNIQILSCDDLGIIDMIETTHPSEQIQCFDIAEISKDIISYSTLNLEGHGEVSKHLVVHGLQDTSYLNGVDNAVTQRIQRLKGHNQSMHQAPQYLKWKEYWSCDPKVLIFDQFLNTVSLSPYGDVLVLGGHEFLSLWTRDTNMSSHSYSMYVYYAKNLQANIFASVIEEKQIEQVIQTEFSSDSRAFVTLELETESNDQLLKVWFNLNMQNVKPSKIKKEFVSRNPKREFKNEELVKFKPPAVTRIEFLDFFQIPWTKRWGKILYFKMIDWPQSFFANQKVVPIAFLTVTDRQQAQLWMEDLNFAPSYNQSSPDDSQKALKFSCVHVFAPVKAKGPKSKCFDVQFLHLSSNDNSSSYLSTPIDSRSRILDPESSDYIQLAKTAVHARFFDNMVEPSLCKSGSKDFIVVLTDGHIQVHSILGLRHFPTGALEVELQTNVPLAFHLRSDSRFLQFNKLLACASDSLAADDQLSDELSLICLNRDHSLLKLTKSIDFETTFDVSPFFSQWKVSALKVRSNYKATPSRINRVCVAQYLPLVAVQHDFQTILFYTEIGSATQVRNKQALADPLKFLGQYEAASNSQIKQIKWIPGLCQMLVLLEDNKVNVISSKTLTHIIQEMTVQSEFQDFNTIYHEQLKNLVRIESFETILENVLPDAATGPSIIDFVIIGIQYLTSDLEKSKFTYKVNVATIHQLSIDFYELLISCEEASNMLLESVSVEARKLASQPFGESQEIHSLLCEQNEPGHQGRVYENPNPIQKCILKTINAKRTFDVGYVEICSNGFKLLWQRVLPAQLAPMASQRVVNNAKDGLSQPGGSQVLQIAQTAPLEYTLSARMSTKYASILTRHVGKGWYFLYIYEHQLLNRYLGYLDLIDFVDFAPHDRTVFMKSGFAIDYSLTQAQGSETVVFSCLDRLYVICYDRTDRRWALKHQVNLISGMDIRVIKSVKITATPRDNIILVINHEEITTVNSFLQVFGTDIIKEIQEDDEEEAINKIGKPKEEVELKRTNEASTSIAELGFKLLKSNPIHSVNVLKDLYINGKVDFIMTLLIQMNKVLAEELQHAEELRLKKNTRGPAHSSIQGYRNERSRSSKIRVTSVLNYTIKSLLEEVNAFVEAQVVQQDLVAAAAAEEEAGKGKAPKKAEVADFFGGGDSDSDDDSMGGGMIDFDNLPAAGAEKKAKSVKKKVEEVKEVEVKEKVIEQKFLEIFMDLVQNIAKIEAQSKQGGGFGSSELLNFILVFKDIYSKDFFSDEMTSTLMRQVYIETQVADQELLKQIEIHGKEEDTTIVKKLADHEIYAQMYDEKDDDFEQGAYKNGGNVNINALDQWDSRKCALALFTVNQDVILEELQSRFDLENNASWTMIRTVCLPLWMKDTYKLRNMVEWIAKVAYRIAGEDQLKKVGGGTTEISKAEATSLWYMLMNKKGILINLYEKEKGSGGDKVAEMLSQDFSLPRWKKAALKNAMVLRTKQRYLLAITFFLLANDISAALQVMKQSLNDPILAILTCRMLMLQQPENKDIPIALEQVYEEFFLRRGEAFGDVYLQSIGLWNQKKYVQAVNVLQVEQSDALLPERMAVQRLFEQENGFKFGQSVDGKQKTAAEVRAEKKVVKDKYVPLVSEHSGYELVKLIAKLKKAPLVTQALKKDEGAGGYGADGGDIFANFMGASEQKAAKEAEEAKKLQEADKPQLEISNARLLSQLLLESVKKQDMLHALFMLRENREHVDPTDMVQMKQIQLICGQIIKDQVEEIRQNPSFVNESDSLRSQLDSLLSFMLDIKEVGPGVHLNVEDQERRDKLLVMKGYMARCIEQDILETMETLQGAGLKDGGGNALLRYELELRLEARQRQAALKSQGMSIPRDYCSMKTIMIRMEEETLKFTDFLNSSASQPLLENTGKEHEHGIFLQFRSLILDLEHHVECLIIFDHFEDTEPMAVSGEEMAFIELGGPDVQEIEFFHSQDPAVKAELEAAAALKAAAALAAPAKKKPAFDPFEDMMGGESSEEGDLMDFDFRAPPQKKEEPTTAVVQPAEPAAAAISKDDIEAHRLDKLMHSAIIDLRRLGSKVKKSMIMYLCLIIMASQIRKFHIVKDLLSKDDLVSVLGIDSDKIAQLEADSNELKMKIRKARGLRKDGLNTEADQLQKELEKELKDTHSAVKTIYGKLHFQNLKMHIQKLKRRIQKKIGSIESLRQAQRKDDSQTDEEDVESEAEGTQILKQQAHTQQTKMIEEDLYQERWETDLMNAEDAADIALQEKDAKEEEKKKEEKAAESPTRKLEGDEALITLGLLSRSGHVVPETFEFLSLWLKFIVINKTTERLEETLLKGSEEIDEQLLNVFDSTPCLAPSSVPNIHSEKYNNDYQVNISSVELQSELISMQSAFLQQQWNTQGLLQSFRRMSKTLEDECTIYFNEKLQVLQRKYLAAVMGSGLASKQLYPVLMKYFFKSAAKMEQFWDALGVAKRFAKPLGDQYLTLLGKSCTAEQDEFEAMDHVTYHAGQYDMNSLTEAQAPTPKATKGDKQAKHPASRSATQLITQELLGAGIELFKQRGEQISDFAFDNTSNSDNIALGLMTSGIREIPVVNTLLFRNRIESGLQLIDEENLKWEECLHRYEQIAKIMYGQPSRPGAKQPEIIQTKDEPIVTAIDSLYCHKTIFHRSKPLIRRGLNLVGEEVLPTKYWNGSPSDSYLAQTSKLDITHEDYTYPVESHPYLPLYMSGNRRGIICTWRFGQEMDKSLNQFMPEVDPRQADPKKACVKKIMFNRYGDKIMSNNMEGSFSIYQIDCQSKHMRKVPIFSLYENVDSKVNDFDLVNSDNIICTISQKQKTVKVYDTLLPYGTGKQAQIMEFKLPQSNSCGNIILCNQRKQTVYTFNGRTGAMAELDLRMSLALVNQYQLSQSHEITAACLNQSQDTLVTGYKDGHVKIHRLDKYFEAPGKDQKHLELREKIDAFPFDFRSKKGTVQRIKINKTGGLFASSQAGILKLLRTSV